MKDKKKAIIKWLPLALLILLLIATLQSGFYKLISFQSLKLHQQTLTFWIDKHYIVSSLLFMLLYIFSVAISLPGASLLTVLAGFLFGYTGIIYVVTSATIGATLIFLSVKTSLGAWLKQRTNQWVALMEAGFNENSFHYLLFLRLLPLFPFWAVNIVAGLLDISPGVFLGATFIGIIPGSAVYIAIGAGLKSTIQISAEPNLFNILTPKILIPMFALAFISLLPIIYKRFKRQAND